MKVLVIGNGARSSALCWKLRQSPLLTELTAPRASGIAALADRVPLAPEEVQRLADFAAEMRIDLTVAGPELPLTLGIADEFANRGLPIFGPTQRAAEIEGSKVFSKLFMDRHGIPTAPFAVVHDAAAARAEAARFGFPVVLKADGLAAGKGVLIAADEAGLAEAVRTLFEERRFGASGDRVLVEAFLPGEEVSFMALCDGERVLPLATARDYKRIGDGDTGPNTGGMGAHSPSGGLSAETAAEVVEAVMRPAVAGLAAEGRPFVGVLYAGPTPTSRTAVAGHQPGVEHAHERPPLGGKPGDRRPHHRLHDLGGGLGREPSRRAVISHAAGVRAGVAVADPLVIAGGGERQHPLAVAEGHEGDLLARQESLDQHPVAAGAEAALLEQGADGLGELGLVAAIAPPCRRRGRPP